MQKKLSARMLAEPIYELKDYIAPGVSALNNRTWGIAIRSAIGIDNEAFLKPKTITIKISKEINSINTLFLEELFENVVQNIGVDAFRKKFRIEGEGQYTEDKIKFYLDQALERIGKYATAD